MKWLVSIAVALLTAIIALFAAGLVGALLADWYNVSSFEGQSGFFVIAIAILGLMGGFVIGLVTSRVVASRPDAGFGRALGYSCAIVLGILVAISGIARLLADIPPTIDGETLYLQVELRWPASGAADPRSMPGAGYTRLGTSTGSVVRRQEDGPLFVEDARQEDGRWIVPGVVDVFTSRGQRVLDLGIGETSLAAFVVPLPGHPHEDQHTWSDWLPHARPGAAPLPDQFTFRFRVIRQSEPVRVERAGPFEVGVIARYFYNVQGADRLAANSSFRVLFKGQPVPGFDNILSVALVAAPKTTLLINADTRDRPGACHLITDDGDRATVTTLGSCTGPIGARPVTSDEARFRTAKAMEVVPGWLDRTTFSTPGLYLTNETVLDTRNMTSWTFPTPSPYPISELPPLGVSPDEKNLIRFAYNGSDEHPVLVVVGFQDQRSYVVPIDRARMRYGTYETIDPAWVDHHFEWVRNNGVDTLQERSTFSPLPFKGEYTPKRRGQYQTYTIRPGKEPLRAAIVGILMEESGAERLPDEIGGYHQRVRIDGRILSVTVVDSASYVYVSMESGKEEPEFMSRIARLLDNAFATGQYDGSFATDERQK